LCFGVFEIVGHGGCQGNTAQALAQWRHLVASHEATDALHWAMHIAPYCPGGTGFEVIVNLPAFFVNVNSIVAHNHS
jgi:hypothetical protein